MPVVVVTLVATRCKLFSSYLQTKKIVSSHTQGESSLLCLSSVTRVNNSQALWTEKYTLKKKTKKPSSFLLWGGFRGVGLGHDS
jgi:hypothetical protein